MAHAGGRPTKLSRKLIAAFCAALAEVYYTSTAAALVGLDRTTVWGWLQDGAEAKSGLLREFFNAVERTKAQSERDLLRPVVTGADNWQARAWILERAYQDHWVITQRLDVTVRESATRLAAEHGLDADALLAEADRIARGAYPPA